MDTSEQGKHGTFVTRIGLLWLEKAGVLKRFTEMLEIARKACGLHWNPIGVPMRGYNSEPGQDKPWYMPPDEYDTYLEHVLRMINLGNNDDEIVEYLTRVEYDYLGLDIPRGDKRFFLAFLRTELQI